MLPEDTNEKPVLQTEPRGNTPAQSEDPILAAQARTPSEDTVLAAKDEEIRTLVDRLKRLQAEFENYRKRILRDLAAAEERTSDREILAFLPLYDNLERAFAAYANDADLAALVSGVERIFGQFAQILEQKGVRRIVALGERFDPALHEALLSIHSQKEKGIILEEFSPGYVRGERTLQPSKVTVSHGPAQAEKEAE